MILLLIVILAGLAAAGVVLVFIALASRPQTERPAGGHTPLSGAFEAVAAQVSVRQQRRGKPPLSERLARAGLRLKPSEYVMLQTLCAVVLGGVCFLRFGVNPVVIVGAVLGLLLPGLYLKYRTRRRLKALDQQLVDVLTLMSNSLRAGHALPQTLQLIAQDSRPPISEEFSRCVRELQVGGSMEVALANLARRSGSEDLDLMVTAMLVQMTVGGNLAATLEKISETIRDRIRVKGEISASTAHGRMSGWIITMLPVGLGALLFFISPSYFRPMTQGLLGWVMLGGAGFLILIGNLFIRKVVKVDV
jgi:tight adherence protein B